MADEALYYALAHSRGREAEDKAQCLAETSALSTGSHRPPKAQRGRGVTGTIRQSGCCVSWASEDEKEVEN